MISLPLVKARLTALLEDSAAFVYVPILGRPLEAGDDYGDGADWEGWAKFDDATETGIAGDITKPEMCGDPDRGWLEEYELTLLIQVTSTGESAHDDLERVRALCGAACIAACNDPNLGLNATPDPDGYVTMVDVRPTGWTGVISGVSRTEGFGDAPIVAGGFVFNVAAEINATP